jgi:hypothetical protein
VISSLPSLLQYPISPVSPVGLDIRNFDSFSAHSGQHPEMVLQQAALQFEEKSATRVAPYHGLPPDFHSVNHFRQPAFLFPDPQQAQPLFG